MLVGNDLQRQSKLPKSSPFRFRFKKKNVAHLFLFFFFSLPKMEHQSKRNEIIIKTTQEPICDSVPLETESRKRKDVVSVTEEDSKHETMSQDNTIHEPNQQKKTKKCRQSTRNHGNDQFKRKKATRE